MITLLFSLAGNAKTGTCAVALLEPNEQYYHAPPNEADFMRVTGEEGTCTDVDVGGGGSSCGECAAGLIEIEFQTISLPCQDNDDDGYLE